MYGRLELRNDSSEKIKQKIAKKFKNWEEFVAKKQIELDKQVLMNCLCIKRWILQLWVGCWLKFRIYRAKWFLVRRERVLGSWNSEQLWSDPRSESTSHRVPRPCLAAILDCRMIHGISWVLQETSLNDYLLEKDEPLLSDNSKNLATSSHELRPDIPGNTKRSEKEMRRALLYSSIPAPRFQRGAGVYDHTGATYSDWWSEISYDGMESWRISWLYGISQLESRLQNWSLSKNSRSSDQYALDQSSGDCKINWRTSDIAIDCGAKRSLRLQYAGCDDCVCSEQPSRHASSLPQKSMCRRSSVLKNTTDSFEEDKLLTWSSSISVQLELMKWYKDSQMWSV